MEYKIDTRVFGSWWELFGGFGDVARRRHPQRGSDKSVTSGGNRKSRWDIKVACQVDNECNFFLRGGRGSKNTLLLDATSSVRLKKYLELYQGGYLKKWQRKMAANQQQDL